MRGLDERLTKKSEGFVGWSPEASARNRGADASARLCPDVELQTFDSFATLASNIHAVEAALLFTAGLQTFACLVGPSGWGKTHLIHAADFRLRTELGRGRCHVVDASEWVTRPPRIDPSAPLLIDNAQDALSRGRLRVPFRLALERRVRAGRPTLLATAADRVDRSIRSQLPMSREWAIAGITGPSRHEMPTLVHRISRSQGLELGPCTELLLAKGLNGNGRTLRGALVRLKHHGVRWPDERAALRACGVASPFFADNSEWDLAGTILHTASEFGPSPQDAEPLALYTMLGVALLPEAEVARAFGIEPAAVYLRASRFEEQMRRDEGLQRRLSSFVCAVVQRLHTI